jgi:uncharacterized protein (DUF3820 family)
MMDLRQDFSSLRAGQNRIGFGKHQGRTYIDVAANEPGYCDWATRQRDPAPALEHFVDYLFMMNNDELTQETEIEDDEDDGGVAHEDESEQYLDFGKYANLTFRQVTLDHPEYIQWAQTLATPGSQLQRLLEWAYDHPPDLDSDDEEEEEDEEQRAYLNILDLLDFVGQDS